MHNEILTALREAAKALRSGGSGGQKIRLNKNQIKSARKSLNLTQEEFAEKVGVSVKTVSSWEQGSRKPGALAQAMLGALLSEVKSSEPA